MRSLFFILLVAYQRTQIPSRVTVPWRLTPFKEVVLVMLFQFNQGGLHARMENKIKLLLGPNIKRF